MSSLNSSTSSKKDDSLKLDRESRELNDSEEEGDLLEDDDEVRRRAPRRIQRFRYSTHAPSFVQVKSRSREDEDDEEEEGEHEEGEDDGDSANEDDP